MKNLFLYTITFVLLGGLNSCNKQNSINSIEEAVVGKWKMEQLSINNQRQIMQQDLYWDFYDNKEFYMAFIDNNGVIIDQMKGTWEIEKRKKERYLKLESTAFNYGFLILEANDNTLKLFNEEDSEKTEFIKYN